jgi:hypothetical protein
MLSEALTTYQQLGMQTYAESARTLSLDAARSTPYPAVTARLRPGRTAH